MMSNYPDNFQGHPDDDITEEMEEAQAAVESIDLIVQEIKSEAAGMIARKLADNAFLDDVTTGEAQLFADLVEEAANEMFFRIREGFERQARGDEW